MGTHMEAGACDKCGVELEAGQVGLCADCLAPLPVLKTGVLAFIDTLQSGLVPCKVVRVESCKRQDGKPVAHVVVKVTAPRYAYKRGDVATSESPGHIVPRDAVRRFRGQVFQRILPFTVECDHA